MTTDTLEIDANLDALLETNLDDVEDLPEYADYLPTGHYHLKIVESGFESVDMAVDKKDESKGKKAVTIAKVVYEIVEVKELSKPEQLELVKPNMRFSASFFFNKDPKKTTEVIKAQFKELAKLLPTGTSVKDLVKGIQGMEVLATVSSTKRTGTEDQFFINTKNITPL